jgi:hypothetical protein
VQQVVSSYRGDDERYRKLLREGPGRLRLAGDRDELAVQALVVSLLVVVLQVLAHSGA